MKTLDYSDDNLSKCGSGYCALPAHHNCERNHNECCYNVSVSKASEITDQELIEEIEAYLTCIRYEEAKENK